MDTTASEVENLERQSVNDTGVIKRETSTAEKYERDKDNKEEEVVKEEAGKVEVEEEAVIENIEKEEVEEVEEEEEKEEKSAIFETRVETAEERKGEGNELFKRGDWAAALKKYRAGLYQVEFDEMSWNFELMDDHRDMVNNVRLPLLLNSAACSLKVESEKALSQALEFCEEALKIDQKNAKALFRKAQALLKQEKVEKSVDVLKEAVKAAPGDKLIRATLARAVAQLKSEKSQTDAFWKQKLQTEMASLQPAKGEESKGDQGVCRAFLDRLKEMFVSPKPAVRDQ